MITMSYAITVCNEFIEIQKLISHLLENIDLSVDEIIVLCDISKPDSRVIEFCEKQDKNIKFYTDVFDNHFANWKNKLKNMCSKEYIFQIDADEIPNPFLLKNIKKIISENKGIELFWIPRENYVANLTSEHIIEWGWQVDHLHRINFPDYQARLFKNYPHIMWKNNVHEIIIGSNSQALIPADPKLCLLHEKTIDKQDKQNNYYNTL